MKIDEVGFHHVGLLALYVAVSLLSSTVFAYTGFVQFDPAVGLLVPFSILFGLFGILAAALGVIVRDLLHGAVGMSTWIVVVSHLLAGYLVYRLRPVLTPLSKAGTVRDWAGWLGRFAFVALVGSLVVAALVGWGNELFGLAPFYLTANTAIQYLLATILLGLPFLIVVDSLIMRDRVAVRSRSRLSYFGSSVAMISVVWLGFGVVGSLGFRLVTAFPDTSLQGAGLGFVVWLADPSLFGAGAVHALTVLSVLSLTLLGLVLVADHRESAVSQ